LSHLNLQNFIRKNLIGGAHLHRLFDLLGLGNNLWTWQRTRSVTFEEGEMSQDDMNTMTTK